MRTSTNCQLFFAHISGCIRQSRNSVSNASRFRISGVKWTKSAFRKNWISSAIALTAFSSAVYFWKVQTSKDITLIDLVKEKCSSQRIITEEELAKHKSVDDGGIWVSFRGKVYDITKFVDMHPGGDKILLAAGSDLMPYWSLYAFHFEDHVMEIIKDYYIGDLPPQKDAHSTSVGPYASEPYRHSALLTQTKEPRNAETPSALIPDYPVTPTDLFFVRNHFPVPNIDIKSHRLVITATGLPESRLVNESLSVDELKQSFSPHTVTSTVVCAGNRRSDMANEDNLRATERNTKASVRGIGWKQSAISTAKWTGVRLVDLIAHYLCPDDTVPDYAKLMDVAKQSNIRHVQFIGADVDILGENFGASIPVEWALDPQMEVIIAYEMNGEPLTRDHGYPLRAIVPGSIGARQVKWLSGINLSSEESPSFYQREDYKIGYPVPDGTAPDYLKLPAILDYPVQSAICEPTDGHVIHNSGSITVKGYAFSGGGRGILSVRVSADDGITWSEATLYPVSPPAGIDPSTLPEGDSSLEHRTRRQWAWTLWEAEIPVSAEATEVELVCCARDSSNAVQPKTSEANLNVRGLLTNSWHRVRVRLKNESD